MANKKLPSINYTVSRFEDYELITTLSQTKKKIFDRLVECVSMGIESKKESVDMFKIYDTDEVIHLDRGKWKESLTNAIRFYTETEEYEKCAECKNLMDKI